MPLRPTKIRKNSKTFQRLCGHGVAEFDTILQILAPKWHQLWFHATKRPVATTNWTFQTWFWCFCCIIDAMWLRFLWGSVWDWWRSCVPHYPASWAYCSQRHGPPKGPKLSKEEVESLMIDATQQAIKRPKKRPKILLFWEKETTHS